MGDFFRRFARSTSDLLGRPEAFLAALAAIVIWAILGPVYRYSDTWQLVINTATTIVTFLMVFLIQNTQNRDAKAIHLKLDELLRGVKGARTSLVRLEELTDAELKELEMSFEALRQKTNSPKIISAEHARLDTEAPGSTEAPSPTSHP